LTQSGHVREELLKELGYATGKVGLDAAASANPTLQDTYQELLDVAMQANQLNISNGMVIDIHLKRNQQTLDALRNLAGGNNLYDASGRAKNLPAKKKGIKVG